MECQFHNKHALCLEKITEISKSASGNKSELEKLFQTHGKVLVAMLGKKFDDQQSNFEKLAKTEEQQTKFDELTKILEEQKSAYEEIISNKIEEQDAKFEELVKVMGEQLVKFEECLEKKSLEQTSKMESNNKALIELVEKKFEGMTKVFNLAKIE